MSIKITEKANNIFDKTVDVLMAIAGVLVIFDAIAISLDVILRKTAGVSISGLFEITTYTLPWMTFLGTTWLLRQNGHVRLDAVVNRLKPRTQAIINVISSLITAVLMAVVVWYGTKLTVYDYQVGFRLQSLIQPVKWPIEMIIPIGSFLFFIMSLRNAFRNIKGLKTIPDSRQT